MNPESHVSVQAAWHEEMQSRLDEITRGDAELVDGRETLARARAQLAARRK